MNLFVLSVFLQLLMLQVAEIQAAPKILDTNAQNGGPILVHMVDVLEHAAPECRKFLTANDFLNAKILNEKLAKGGSVGFEFLRENGCESEVTYMAGLQEKTKDDVSYLSDNEV